MTRWTGFVPAILAVLVGTGCVTTGEVDRRGDMVERLLQEQHEPMYWCTPVELARAEANLAFARHETSRGRPLTAKRYLEASEGQARTAFENSRDRSCYADRDGDRIPDKDDQCPDTPEDLDRFQDDDGCPDVDNDGDGLPDGGDQCPNEHGPRDNRGCPVTDADGDGIPDKEDRCPNEYGPAANGGCPIRDRDKDGLPDPQDKCPDEAGPLDNDGCPYKLIEVTEKAIVLKQKVFFQFGKAKILPESYPLLDEVSRAMTDHPTFVVRVEGHTDNIGKAAANRKLSQARAEAVRKYLLGKGIEAERMKAVGYGDTVPIDDNSSEEGRAVNRRVEFNIVSK